MKKRLLITIILCPMAFFASAQCTPNPLYADSAFGVWPDTLEGLAPAIEGVLYSDTLNFKVPTDGGDIDPNFAGFVIDSIILNTIDGMPPGLAYECNSNTPSPCTFIGGNQGCGLIEGTPTTQGSYPMVIQVTAYTFLGVVIPVPYSFSGYVINVGPLGVEENLGNISKVEQNIPNPFNGETRINVSLRSGANIEFAVHDMVGKTLHQRTVRGIAGSNQIIFDGSILGQGIYLYTITSNGQSVTKRMIIK